MSIITKNVPLRNYSNYKIGGNAKFFAEVTSTEELKEVLLHAKSLSLDRISILGAGTNFLISDQDFDGLVIHNKIEGINIAEKGLKVGSGVLVKDLLDFCIENSLSGFEWAGGLPGTIAGAVRGNAGAFRGETKDSVLEVESLDMKTLEEKRRDNVECQFGYRNSVFKSGDGSFEFVTHIILGLIPADKDKIKEKIQEKIDYRNNRHPMNYPSIGSTFKNIPLDSLSQSLQKEFAQFVKTDPFPVVPTKKLLNLCNLEGKRVGGAMISERHPNFIVNVDNAKAKDVEALILIAKDAVKKKYGINLEEEIIHLN